MKRWVLWFGPILSLAIGASLLSAGQPWAIAATLGVTTLTALWWVFEPIPIPATSLIPIALFPLLGVLTAEQVAMAYGDKLVLLFLGGFMLSAALERSGAHRRIALMMVSLFGGTSGRRLVLGFMTAAAVLSMWISNTATSLMLLPIALAVLEKTANRRLETALLLGIAYAASVGGVGTPIGTPPNLVFMHVYTAHTGIEITFTQWMVWAIPAVVLMVPVVGLWLTRDLQLQGAVELPPVGRWRTEEIRTLAVFAITALLWVTRKGPAGGWSAWLNLPGANDASVALLAVVAMFLIPDGKGSQLLDWKRASQIPWGVLILFASGITVAKAFIESGLSELIGNSMVGLATLPQVLLVGSICLSVTFLTEMTSNTATTNLLMPILATAASAAGAEPKQLMIPAAMSASFAFMLPVATGPNAVVYGSGKLSVAKMVREGFVLNLLGVVVITTVCMVMLY